MQYIKDITQIIKRKDNKMKTIKRENDKIIEIEKIDNSALILSKTKLIKLKMKLNYLLNDKKCISEKHEGSNCKKRTKTK